MRPCPTFREGFVYLLSDLSVGMGEQGLLTKLDSRAHKAPYGHFREQAVHKRPHMGRRSSHRRCSEPAVKARLKELLASRRRCLAGVLHTGVEVPSLEASAKWDSRTGFSPWCT